MSSNNSGSPLIAWMALPLLIIVIGTAWWVFDTLNTTAPATPPLSPDDSRLGNELAANEAQRIQRDAGTETDPLRLDTALSSPQGGTASNTIAGRPPIADLPSLNESDPVIIQETAKMQGGEHLARLLISENLLLKAVRAIIALDENEVVKDYRPVVPPEPGFRVIPLDEELDPSVGQRYRIDPANYDRYTPYIVALESVSAALLADLYEHFYPLLQEAYAQYGVDRGTFRDVTLRALDRLIGLEIMEEPAILIQPKVFFKYQDPHLEARSAPHKLLMRIGVDNAQRLQAVLRALREELTPVFGEMED